MSSRALRKLQNDDDLLASILASKEAKVKQTKPVKKPAMAVNSFAMMNMDDSDNDDVASTSEEDSENKQPAEIAEPVKLLTKSQRRRQQKKKKQLQNKKKLEESNSESDNDSEDEEVLDKLLQEYKKKDIKNLNKLASVDLDADSDSDFVTASESDQDDDEYVIDSEERITGDLENDTTFEKFPIKFLRHSERFFNTDFRKLDPHSEFKLLFDDISPESLEDIDSVTSTSISPQQLKQIQRMKRLVRNWGGKNRRSVPNGPGGAPHILKFTKVREDWIPSPRGEFGMKLLSTDEIIDWQLWQRPTDWKDVIEQDIKKWKKEISFYKFEPLDDDTNRKAITEFYLSVIVHPDHEALISLISSKYPYHVPALLQVALIMIRQGDRSNTNGLLQRALFVFDRALKATINFDGTSCQLPYIYFFNRQFYLAIFRYVLALAQRGAITTAAEWCKVLWSLSPLEDPLGCRYFIDHYLLLNTDYNYIISLSNSPLMNSYKQWYTFGLSLATVYSYFKIDEISKAKKELQKCFYYHAPAVLHLFQEKLSGNGNLEENLNVAAFPSELIEAKAYMSRFSAIWKDASEINFLQEEISNLLQKYASDKSLVDSRFLSNNEEIPDDVDENPFFVDNIPINLLRFAILSEESSVMASIPSNIWSDCEVYEFDVLPPTPTSKESLEVIETVKTFINDKDLATSQAMLLQDEDMLNQIRQLSLQQYIAQNETNNDE